VKARLAWPREITSSLFSPSSGRIAEGDLNSAADAAVDYSKEIERTVCLNDGSLPIRLSRDNGSWELELYRLVAVGQDVYRPRRTRVSGEKAIVSYLVERDPNGTLAHTTSLLMQCFPKCEGHFVAVNGEWSLVHPTRHRLRVVTATVPIPGAELLADAVLSS
jgi:hypothetical protein